MLLWELISSVRAFQLILRHQFGMRSFYSLISWLNLVPHSVSRKDMWNRASLSRFQGGFDILSSCDNMCSQMCPSTKSVKNVSSATLNMAKRSFCCYEAVLKFTCRMSKVWNFNKLSKQLNKVTSCPFIKWVRLKGHDDWCPFIKAS